ncbi:hypothetical protein SERV_ORF48 [short-finned eel virus]|uniref:Uncharacterized protein n=1 Tax=short-finned eel virus TaxID=2848076 RepID=A0A192GQ81_FRG3V|nr:hypothetical protein SERV_ORF48 [Short-finned eel ranavirus]ANK58100.1 hypothetical protein SERV_ORF48 [Short-finned eel ranavirus]
MFALETYKCKNSSRSFKRIMDATDIFGDISDIGSDSSGDEAEFEHDENVERAGYEEPDDDGDDGADPVNQAEAEEAAAVREAPSVVMPLDMESYSDEELAMMPLGAFASRLTQMTAIRDALLSDFRSTGDLVTVSDKYLRMVAILILNNRDSLPNPYAAYNLLQYASKRGLVNPEQA